MRIGINGSSLIATGRSVAEIGVHTAEAETHGFSTYWMAQLDVPDALTAIAAIGHQTSTIEFGTAVIPTWTRHPLMLAAQALTTQEVIGNRLVLGIGLAHQLSVEATWKIPFVRPAKNMEEYLSVLLPAMQERAVSFDGEFWSGEVAAVNGVPGAVAPSVMLAAMGPRMLQQAASRTDGTILWLAGPRTVDEYIRPSIEAARPAEMGPARIVASVPVCVTADPDGMRKLIGDFLVGYNDLPSYRQIMDREGAAGPQDVALVGDETEVAAGIERFAAAGVTDFAPVEFVLSPDDAVRTRDLLRSLL